MRDIAKNLGIGKVGDNEDATAPGIQSSALVGGPLAPNVPLLPSEDRCLLAGS